MSNPDAPLPAEAVAAMIAHMNDDHADAVLGYVRRFGALRDAEAATLVAIEPTRMLIHATASGIVQPVEIAFDHTLRDAGDARDTLIAMAKDE